MWFKSWFNSPYYHLLYRRRDEQEAAEFIDHIFKYLQPNKEEWILDFGCGKGRHSIYMNGLGYKVEGIDISEQNIAYAKAFENPRLHFALHDMRETYKPGHFGTILNLFTSFGYFDCSDENLKILKAANANLKPKGRFLIDYLNVDLLKNNLVEKESQEIDGVKFEITRAIKGEMVVKVITVHDRGLSFEFQEQVKLINKQGFKGLLAKAGFEVLDIFGNYDLNQYNPATSPRLIVIARKTS